MTIRKLSLVTLIAVSVGAARSWAADSNVPGDFATIQLAIDAGTTVAGDTITLTVANHVESNIHVTKAVTIAGAVGASLDPGAGAIGIFPDVDNISIVDLLIQGCSQAIRFEIANGTIDSTILLRVTMLNCTSRGIEVHNLTTVTNLLVEDCTFDTTNIGLRVSSSGHLNDSEFRDSTFVNLVIGIYEANDGGTSTMAGLLVTGCTFENIAPGQGTAIFLEEIQDALIENNTFIDNRRDIQIFKWYQASIPVSNVVIRNNTMTGTMDAVFAIFNRENTLSDPGQTVFDGVLFERNTATIDPSLNDNGSAVFAGAHSGPSLGGIGWETVHINCNTFLQAHTGEGVRFFNPGVPVGQELGGASIDVTNNWWGTADALAVAALMQIPAITDFEPFLTSVPGEICPLICETPIVECFADPAAGDDDDDDSSSGADFSGCELAVSWIAFSPTKCDIEVDAVINIGCAVIPVENGQLVSLECLAPGGDDDDDSSSMGRGDDDDDDGGCSFFFGKDGTLHIVSDVAVLVVTVTDQEGNVALCEVDLCGVCAPAGDDDDDDAPEVGGRKGK